MTEKKFKMTKEYVLDCLLYYIEDSLDTSSYRELSILSKAIEITSKDCQEFTATQNEERESQNV